MNDTKKAKVLLLYLNIDCIQELVSQEMGNLKNPILDETNGRLHVADNEAYLESSVLRDGRILVLATKQT